MSRRKLFSTTFFACSLLLVLQPFLGFCGEALSGWYKYKDTSNKIWPVGVWIGPEGIAKFQLYFKTYQATWTKKGKILLVSYQDSDGDTNVLRYEIRPDNSLFDVDEEKAYSHVD